MSIGLAIALPAYTIDPAFMARRAEELGFESIWYAEHPAVPVVSESPFPATGGEIPWQYSHFTEPFIALARASAVTRTLLLGTGITLVPQRHPLLLAKTVAALDFHSGGRFLFGIGTGWLREEVELMGGDFRYRWTQTREYVEAMKAMWTCDEAEYHGRFIDFPKVKVYPKPITKPHPPVLIGGMAKRVLQRVAAHGDGWLPNRVSASDVEAARAKLDVLARERGRDPNSISITVYGHPAKRTVVQDFFNAGANRVVVRPERHVHSESEMSALLEQMAEAVIGR